MRKPDWGKGETLHMKKDRETERQRDRETERQKDRKTDKWIKADK